jgi:fatty acid CoA ligase FadD21
MSQSTILSMLHGRASLRPNDVAFTFTDYEKDYAGVPESLTWSQLSRQVMTVAREIRAHGSVGDRAVILAPQGLDYIRAFLGAMQAGFIAVPLPLPHRGSSYDRVGAVFADTAPSVVLTTSSTAEDVGDYVDQSRMDTAPKIVAIDSLSLDAQGGTSLAQADVPNIAYLQYSSGSTRVPTGVMMSHRNVTVNFEQLMASFFTNSKLPSDTTIVSWLPFYHDMGLVLLGSVVGIISGAERVEPTTLHRFVDRFSHFKFKDHMMRPSYGLAEATVFVTAGTWSESESAAHFDVGELGVGRVEPCAPGAGSELVSYAIPRSPLLRIVDTETLRECPPDLIGEIWVHGENVAEGYWHKPPEEQACFGATLADPSPGTPDGPWLRTGDLGFIYKDELYIVGRIKDLLIIRGRNHYPEDIEATVQQIAQGRVAAISVPVDSTEQLVTVIEVKKKRGEANEDLRHRLSGVKSDVTSAISNAHGLNVGDVVMVPAGSIPITTSGKIRRAACVQQYRGDQFARLDA